MSQKGRGNLAWFMLIEEVEGLVEIGDSDPLSPFSAYAKEGQSLDALRHWFVQTTDPSIKYSYKLKLVRVRLGKPAHTQERNQRIYSRYKRLVGRRITSEFSKELAKTLGTPAPRVESERISRYDPFWQDTVYVRTIKHYVLPETGLRFKRDEKLSKGTVRKILGREWHLKPDTIKKIIRAGISADAYVEAQGLTE